MNVLSWIVNESFANRLTLTLFHFLWQGGLVGLVALLGCSLLSGGSARLRYAIHVAAMLVMAACLPVTFLLIGEGSLTIHREISSRSGFSSQTPGAEVAPNPLGGASSDIAFEALEPPIQLPDESQSNGGHSNSVAHAELAPIASPSLRQDWILNLISITSQWIAVFYVMGVAAFLGRLFIGVCGGYRLRKMSSAITDKEIVASLNALARSLGMQVLPAIAWCDRISIPVVVGVLRPMILLPTGVDADLTPWQLRAILLHELSHIRRLDPLVNLLQRIVEAALFFHPVVWVVSRRITLERELAADDMVLAAGWDRPQYADALVRMAELASRVSGSDMPRRFGLLAASGARPSELKIRILRLLGSSPPPQLNLSRGIISSLVLLVTGGAVLAWSQHSSPGAAKDLPIEKNVANAARQLPDEQDDEDRAAELDKEPYDAYMKIMDFAPMSECKAAIKRLDDGGVTKLAAQSRERLAHRWKSISEAPVESFLREIPKTDAGDDVERGGGDRIGVQTELDGVWSNGKGSAEGWRDWIVRKQEDYRIGRLQLLFEAAERYCKLGDAARAKRALIAGLSGFEIYDADLNTLIKRYWPITSDDPAKSLGSGPHAWTLANFLTELSSAQQSLGEIDEAIVTHSRLMLIHFMLSWKHPSAGPTQHARELWSLIRKKPESAPPLFWFNVMDEGNATQKFDLSTVGQKDQLLTHHHQNVTAAPSLDFAELKITAKTRGQKGLLDVNRINQEGKQESIGVLRPAANGGTEQTIAATLKVPANTGLVQFLVAGDDFQVGDVTVDATFTKRSEKAVKSIRQGRGVTSASGATILQKPSVLLPDHWILSALGFDNNDNELVTASTQSFATIRRWDLVGRRLLSEIKLQADQHGRPFRQETMKLSGDRKRVVAATNEYVGIWDASSGELLKKLPFPTKSGIYDCCISMLDCTPDLSVIAGNWSMPGRLTLSYDAHVMIWNGNSGEHLQTIIDKGATDLKSIDLSADGTRLATTNGSGATVWYTSTGRELLHVPNDNTGRKHPDAEVSDSATSHVWSVQLSPSGEQFAFGDILGVKLVDARSGKLLHQLEGPHRYGLGTLVFSPDGQWLARLGTEDRIDADKTRDVVPIWSTQTGEKHFELYTEANDASFSADGKRIAIGFSDMQQGLAIWKLDEDTEAPTAIKGPGPDSRVDKIEENGHYRGKVAAEYAERFKPTWNRATHGLEYGIAFTKPRSEYRIGERVPLVVFFRNGGERAVKFNTRPDFYGNPPKILDAKGAAVQVETIPLLGQIPHYHEALEPGEVLGPFYLSFGLGENPRPGKQHWHPFVKSPLAGKYSLAHSVKVNVASPDKDSVSAPAELTTSSLELEIVE